ncbi:MAG: hypothetical protein IKN55_06640 [Oscillospiraceae bacterium]|nr:hypothetical protein [Oscillospiraceae bacterium]
MKQRIRRIFAVLMIHLVVSFTALAAIRVYQQSYNTTHREQIRMASLTFGSSQVELCVLGKRCTVPLTFLREDSMAYYAAYFLTNGAVHAWIFAVSEFTKQT